MHRIVVSASLLALAAFPLSATAQHGHGSMEKTVATSNAPMSEGVVRKIDRKAGEITIAHGPLVNLGMPKMTMTFRLKDPASLNGIKEGADIRFVAENVNGELTVVSVQAVK